MKDEIKEKIKAYYVSNDIDKILYYITNLQQQNNSLRGNIKRYAKKVKNQRDEIAGLLIQQDKFKKRHIFLKQAKNNLQKELEELREYKKNATRKHWQSLCAEKNLEIIKLKDYKSRCEKALMYAKLLNKRIKVDYLIEILQGSDKE